MILIGAIAVGAIAALALLRYVHHVEKSATPNPVSVWVIQSPIKRGTSYANAAASIKKKTIPAEFRPDSFVSDPKQLENKVAITDLAANQVLVQGMFVNADVASTSFRGRLTGDNVAIALPIDGVRAVGGLLQPGDEVNILVTVGSPSSTPPPAPSGGGQPVQLNASPYKNGARYFYEKVRILAIGTDVRPVAGEAVNSKTATSTPTVNSGGSIIFEVPSDVAQRLASVDPANLYLTLIPENWKPTAMGPITPQELTGLLPGEDAAKLTPYGPNGYTPTAGKGN